MATNIFLGEPSLNVKQWIIDHVAPATRAETRVWWSNDPNDYSDILIKGALNSSAFDIDSHSIKDIIKIKIGNSVTSIGSLAFSGCSELTEVTIPNSVESIEGAAFFGCNNLVNVYMLGFTTDQVLSNVNNWAIGLDSNYNPFTVVVYCKDGNIVLNSSDGDDSSSGIVEHPETRVTYAENSSIEPKKQSFNIEGTFTFGSISGGEDYTIEAKEIDIGNTITSIAVGAFQNCINLMNVIIPTSVKSIGENAF